MKPILILQLRPENEVADGEYNAFMEKGHIAESDLHRIRLERDDLPPDLSLDDYSAVIVGGGPGCVSDKPEDKLPDEARAEAAIMGLMPEITRRDFPFLGCCYGIGILAHHLGADVSKKRYSEPVAPTVGRLTEEGRRDPLLEGLPEEFDILVGHKEAVQELPRGSVHLMSSDACPYQMIRYGENVYATQFHPEADGQVFADRVEFYKHRGYFPLEEAARVTERCLAADAGTPPEILRRFIARYR